MKKTNKLVVTTKGIKFMDKEGNFDLGPKNIKIFDLFITGDGKGFNDEFIKNVKSVLDGNNLEICFGGNDCNLKIKKETTKIYCTLFDELKDEYYEIDTEQLYKILLKNNYKTKNINNKKKKILTIIIIGLIILIPLVMLVLNSVSKSDNLQCSFISIIVSFIAFTIYFIKNNKSKKVINSLPEQGNNQKKMELRYFFDFATTGCLWGDDGLIENEESYEKMGLSKKTINESIKLANEYQGCLDWNDPRKEVWSKQDWADFIERSNKVYERIKEELKAEYIVINKMNLDWQNLEKKYNYDLKQISDELIKIFPEQKEVLENYAKDNNGDLLGHVYFGDEFNANLIELLKDNTEIETINKYCEFIEFMWKNGDDTVVNIVDVTILERLSDDKDIWNKFGQYISKEFKGYINNDLIPNNIMMKHVDKL